MKNIFIITIIICGTLLSCKNNKLTTSDHITLTLADNPHTTQTITWRTDSTETIGEVQYTAIEDSALFAKAIKIKEDSSGILRTDIGSWNIHSKTITDLKPGKTYCYRVGNGNSWSCKSTFTTEADNTSDFKFLIFGDSQSGEANNPDYGKFDTTINNAYKANPDVKFFVNMGDLVEIGGYYAHWNKWFEASKNVINKISIMPVQGNHETYNDTLEKATSKPFNFIHQFKVPQNGPDGFKGQVYSYNYGNVHIAVWDSQIEEEKLDSSMIKNELDWLDKDLKQTDKKWKIVMFHKTPYNNKLKRANEKLKAIIEPVMDKNHVDIVFNGHDHGVSWTYPIKDDKYYEKPSQGTVYYIAGRSGKKTYPDLKPKVWNAFFFDPKDMPDYIVAQANNDQLKIMAYKQDGTAIDTCIIDKLKDALYDGTKKIIAPAFKEPVFVLNGIIDTENKPVKIGDKWYVPSNIINTKFG
ncbi:MAG: metallophosphoesterase family protein, partial [Bacteroidota bacterium]